MNRVILPATSAGKAEVFVSQKEAIRPLATHALIPCFERYTQWELEATIQMLASNMLDRHFAEIRILADKTRVPLYATLVMSCFDEILRLAPRASTGTPAGDFYLTEIKIKVKIS